MESVAPHNLRLEWARNFTSLLRHHIFHISEKVITCLLSEHNVFSEMFNVLLLLRSNNGNVFFFIFIALSDSSPALSPVVFKYR